MDKVAKLKGIVKDLSASSRNIPASDLIKSNRRSAGAVKGWSTRRSSIVKQANDNNETSTVDNARIFMRTSGNIARPRSILTGYAARKLIHSIKRRFPGGASRENKQFSN